MYHCRFASKLAQPPADASMQAARTAVMSFMDRSFA
jgi:hypothetical protein